ncbi:hypothetical protein MJI47_26765, partial [Salmonella enterica subsp. enterica serovar Kentucky]|nr:hypothetical protein [Salmonella enterica subsp. enterica serovar Kentucky]
LKLIDSIIPEPLGGAHRNPEAMAASLKAQLLEDLADLDVLSTSLNHAGNGSASENEPSGHCCCDRYAPYRRQNANLYRRLWFAIP